MATKSSDHSTSMTHPLERKTITTAGAILNPSIDPSAFTRSYNIERKTVSSGPSSEDIIRTKKDESIRQAIPLTKVETVPSDSTASPKHVYVNVSLVNNTDSSVIPAQYQLDFDQPYIKDAEKYYLSIVKASFPTTTIPLFQFRLRTDSELDTGHQKSLSEYGTQITTNNFPLGVYSNLRPVNVRQSTDGTYNISYYQQFIDSVNLSLLNAFCSMKVIDSSFAGLYPPFVTYDSTSNKFKLYSQSQVYLPEKGILSNGAGINFNYKLFRLFNSFSGNVTVVGDLSLVQLMSESQSGLNQSSSSQVCNPLLIGSMQNVLGGLNSTWSPIFQYGAGSVVLYSGNYYGSLAFTNVNYQPDISPSQWQLICSSILNSGTGATIYDSTASYVLSQIVYYPTADSVPYISRVSSNTGNTPSSSPTQWISLAGAGNPTTFNPSATYVTNQNVYYPSVGGTIYQNLTGTAGTNPSTDSTNWKVNSVFNSNVIIGAYSCLGNWADFQSIVIQTASLPIRFEAYAPPVSDLAVGTQSSGSSQAGSQVPRPVLTDLDLVRSENGFDRSPLQYVPPGNYRLVDMFTRPELRQIDSYIQYMHSDLSFSDLLMLPGDSFRIKYLFVRNDAFSLS